LQPTDIFLNIVKNPLVVNTVTVTTEKHKIAVVMPLYNKADEVTRAIDSVLKQTVSDFKLIVVNDGSTDKGPEIVRNINDSRVRIIDQGNAGVSAARNRGISEAQSDLIAFLDADDEWEVSFLETILNLKKKFPTCKVFATNYLYREVNGTFRLPIIRGLPPHFFEGVLDNYFNVAIKSDPPIWTSAVAVTKEAIRSIGMFPVGVTSGEDLLTWAKLAVKYNIAYTTKTCSIFYVPNDIFDRPGRFKDNNDFVSKELFKLLNKIPFREQNGLKKYIGQWHKNRTVSFLELGKHKEARQELHLMDRFSEKTGKWYLYALLAYLPKKITCLLMKGLKRINRLRRSVRNAI
jgi:glycosyltransferase involved in cell wall biosynthesis